MSPLRRSLPLVGLFLAGLASGCRAQTPPRPTVPAPVYVWIEAEQPAATSFPPADRNPFAPQGADEAAVLSGGKWIGADGPRDSALFLEYAITAPREGAYHLYARKFWQHGPFRWRADDGPWHAVGETVLLDEAPIRQFVVANWVSAGQARLTTGRHKLRVELTSNTGAACFDAFLLTLGPVTPRGKLRPGEKYGRAPEGWFPFEPDPDPFAESPIDLRSLNERAAGEHGFIQARGDGFVRSGDGQPIRFWAVNIGGEALRMDDASADYLARSLAKLGVNLVRIHGPVWGDDIRRVDTEHRDRLFAMVAALKRQGIYTCLSIYFPLWMSLRADQGFAGYSGSHPFALPYFSEPFQAMYRGWWRDLLSAPDPRTGKPIVLDPAVAMLEMVNEDSTLFWTFTPYENVPAPQMAIIEKRFGDWLARRHGSVDKAIAAWGAAPVRGDDAAAGRAGFRPLWELFNNRDRRSQETAAFLAELQRDFYEGTYRYLKHDLGFRGAVYASNWITADPRFLGPLDKWSNTVADFMDHHGYFGGPHQGERASYMISPGDRYDDASALLFAPEKPGDPPSFSLPIMDPGYDGKPSTITEINWTAPNRYRADLGLLAAAYGRLQGTDAYFFFATGRPGWDEMIGKFSIRTPVVAGQFPATAFLYRKGLVREAPPVVDVALALPDLFALKGAPVSGPMNLDELRARDLPAGKTAPVADLPSVDPLAFLVGRVGMRFAASGGESRVADLSRYIDRKAGIARSVTGELAWDYRAGRVTVNAPGAQGVTGFLSRAGEVRLGDVTMRSGLPYGTILLVALDGRPIRTSRRMLLQAMSEEMNYGWEAPGTGLRGIRSIGSAPIVVRVLSGTVQLHRPDGAQLRVTPLDLNGYPAGRPSRGPSLRLAPRTLYYLITR